MGLDSIEANEPHMITLPIDSHKAECIELLKNHSGIIISAPPGTGKSTRIPLFCKEWNSEQFTQNRECVMVLQPRRLAAISLATRVASEVGVPLGQKIGYTVRGSKKVSAQSEIQFQTYGHFFETLKSNPALSHVGVLILDEFHERQVEMDLIWAWVHYLKRENKKVPKIVLMSATLDEESMADEIADWGRMHITARMHPIETSYLRAAPNEKLEMQTVKAVKAWLRFGTFGPTGTCLCFLPGWGEIQKVKRFLEEDVLYGRTEIGIEVLHGSLTLAEQSRTCRETDDTRIILTTNIAETSITIPGVTAVIDSGWEREATWNPEKGINSLGLKRITLQSAEQRRGRAGRTGPGYCIRLWEEKWEKEWDQYWRSGLVKEEWSRSLLSVLQLLARSNESSPLKALHALPWLTEPDTAILKTSIAVLAETESIDVSGTPLPGGDWMLSLPVQPRLARVLYLARKTSLYRLSAAIVALLEGSGRKNATSSNMLEEGADLLETQKRKGHSSGSKEVQELFTQLCDREKSFASQERKPSLENDLKNPSLEEIWCSALSSQVAVLTESKRYKLESGFIGGITVGAHDTYPPAILALDIWENVRNGTKTGAIRYWIPLSDLFLKNYTKNHNEVRYRCQWVAQGKKVSVLKENVFREVVISSEKARDDEYPPETIADFLVSEMLSGNVDSPVNAEEFKSSVYRYSLLCSTYPEYLFSQLTEEDFELMLYEWVGESRSMRELSVQSFKQIFLEYIAPEARGLMKSQLPNTITLDSGRIAKVAYFPDAPPELSARITDFAGMSGRFTLCDGRVEGVYNLLAPNYRTAQKTVDLTEFWTNSYPAIKKELRGRYPRHPWP